MRITANIGKKDIAVVYIAETENGKFIEFVESIQPPLHREEKWVLIVSTLYGCPVGCRFCDAGVYFQGTLSNKEILSQIDYLILRRFPNKKVPVKKFKIQFARMGEPSLNNNVLFVLDSLPKLYNAPGLIPCISTVAPTGTDRFFKMLSKIKKEKYPYRFQLQFSIHTTDEKLRDWIIPVKKWSFTKIAEYGNTFYDKRGLKVTLNFALADGFPIEPAVLIRHFSPDIFLIKLTPVNPTYAADKNGLCSQAVSKEWNEVVYSLRSKGYEVILSIGEPEENKIGSNCGQYVLRHRMEKEKMETAYLYDVPEF